MNRTCHCKFRRRVVLLIAAGPLLATGACSEKAGTPRLPVAIDQGDSCYMCGMTIRDFPGPKGQCFIRGTALPLKFCSTRDLYAYATQPEARSVLEEIFVHDMGRSTWEEPDDSAFIDARTAYHVICHPLRGAMGATLATFADSEAAMEFADRFDGRLIDYDSISVELIGSLDREC